MEQDSNGISSGHSCNLPPSLLLLVHLLPEVLYCTIPSTCPNHTPSSNPTGLFSPLSASSQSARGQRRRMLMYLRYMQIHMAIPTAYLRSLSLVARSALALKDKIDLVHCRQPILGPKHRTGFRNATRGPQCSRSGASAQRHSSAFGRERSRGRLGVSTSKRGVSPEFVFLDSGGRHYCRPKPPLR